MRHPIITEDCASALALTRDLWEEVRGQRLFVTGGTGFFGCWLLELLTFAADELGFDCEVVVLTRDPAAFAQGRAGHLATHRCVRLLQGDVRDFDFPAGEFSLVAHFGSTGPRAWLERKPEEFFNFVVTGTQRVLRFAEQAGSRRLLLASTGAVYGANPTGEIRGMEETWCGAPDPTNPAAANPEGKRVAEFLASCLVHRHPELAVGLVRGFAFVGPYLPKEAGFAVDDFLRAAQAAREITVQGDGTAIRSYLYGLDLAVWLWTIWLRTPPGAARPWNVGAEEPVSIRQLAEAVAQLAPQPRLVTIAGQPDLTQRRHVYLPDTSRARQELGLVQQVALHEALRRTLAWMRASDEK
jgi:dTDP-glucose 4,6-dehydratase